MRKKVPGVLALLAVLLVFSVVCEVSWAFKNACPVCKKVIKNLDLTACPACGKIINTCLICGHVNPIGFDNCKKCSASLAESRVSRTIKKEIREDLQLGESPRAKMEVELQQIEQKIDMTGLTPELAVRRVELLIRMGWWSKANAVAGKWSLRFPTADQNAQIAAYRVTALAKLAFLALEEKNKDVAREYLKTALSIDPTDKDSLELLKRAGESKGK